MATNKIKFYTTFEHLGAFAAMANKYWIDMSVEGNFHKDHDTSYYTVTWASTVKASIVPNRKRPNCSKMETWTKESMRRIWAEVHMTLQGWAKKA